MRYILTAISLLAFCTMANAAAPNDSPEFNTKEQIGEFQAQIKHLRAQVKTLRASERVEKAVDKFCTANAENAHYLICAQGPWMEADSVTMPKGKVSKR